MGYRVMITNESGEGIPGVVYFYDNQGTKTGAYEVPVGGIDLPPDLVTQATTFHFDADGYIGVDLLQLGEINNITLVHNDPGSRIGVVILILLGLAVAGKLLKL